jgi:hypothetical protein
MAISGLATVLLIGLSAVALQWIGPPAWLLISVAVGATLLAVVSRPGWLYLIALGLAMSAGQPWSREPWSGLPRCPR